MAKRFKSKSEYAKKGKKENKSSKLNSNKNSQSTSNKEFKNQRENNKFNKNGKVKENNNSSESKLIRTIIFLICLLVFIFSVVNLLRWAIYNKKSANLIENVIEESFSEEIANNQNQISNPVNFGELKNINEDVVGWIKIADTTVNYPIVQSQDNEYYLQRDLNKKYSTCGWIFMNFKNNSNFSDRNTTIFGHNIKSGLMFKDLLKIYRNELGKSVTIEIYTETEKMEFAVYSSYMIEPEEYATQVLTSDEQQEKYVSEILGRSSIIYNIVPTKKDKLITLSTCDNSGQNRILIHGVYVGGEKY